MSLSFLDQAALLANACALWFGIILYRRWQQHTRPEVIFSFKWPHVLQLAIQFGFYVYWGLYYRPVYGHLLWMIPQIIGAYAIDLLLSITLRNKAVFSLAPVPVVLSLNLFFWFAPEEYLLNMLVLGLAIASKGFIQWSTGRHIFNPSALGVAIYCVFCLALPGVFQFRQQDVAHLLMMAPNMTEVIFLMALVPFSRLNSALVGLGGLFSNAFLAFGGIFVPFNQPTYILGITFFASDPSTIPRSQSGRLLFGLSVGMMMGLFRESLIWGFDWESPAKIFPVILANLMVPWLEEAGKLIDAQFAQLGRGMMHLATSFDARVYLGVTLAGWLYFGVASFTMDKEHNLAAFQSTHLRNHTPYMRVTKDGKMRPEDNPHYVKWFSFPWEIYVWATRPRTMTIEGAEATMPLPQGHRSRPTR